MTLQDSLDKEDETFDVKPTKSQVRAREQLDEAIAAYRKQKPRNNHVLFTIALRVTPDLAQLLIELGNPNERHLRVAYVARLAERFKGGKFTATHDPIVLDQRGHRANAQHRLHAIVQANVTVWQPFAADVSDEEIANLDIGKSRSLGDRMALNGDVEKQKAGRLTSVANAMYQGGLLKPRTSEETMWEFVLKHQNLLLDLEEYFNHHKRGIGRGAIMGLFARIAINEPDMMGKLKRAAGILDTGLPDHVEAGDKTIIRLRDLLTGPNMPKTGGTSNIIIYRYASRALRAYLDRQSLSKIRMASDNYFPLPEDDGVTVFPLLKAKAKANGEAS